MQLSIIIPSYNTKQLLQNCLTSIFRETKKIKFEVIVVNNASKDGSVEMVKKKFPKVKLIKLTKNVGYGKANNLGAEKARGEWLLFLNSDTVIQSGTLEKVFKAVQDTEKDSIASPGTGLHLASLQNDKAIFGCKLLNPDGSIQPSAGYFPTLPRVIATMLFLDDLPILKNFLLPYQQENKKFYQKDQEVDWVTGAFLMIKKNLFKKISGFDERFFMYAEEIDLCYRLKKKGAKVLYNSVGETIHIKGASSGNGFKAAVLGEFKGLISFFKKHKPAWQMPVLKLTLFLGALLRMGVFGIIDQSKAKVYREAIKEI